MRTIRLLSLLVWLFPVSAAAQATSNQELARCAAIQDSLRRLECYDGVAKQAIKGPEAAAPDAPSDGATKIEDWVVSIENDPITDRKNATFILPATDSVGIRRSAFIIRCKGGDLDVYIAPGEYLGRDNTGITLRLGNEIPAQQRWSPSSDHTSLFHPGNRGALEAFVRGLAQYEQLAVQVSPYNKAPKALVFRLAGAAEVNERLWQVCPAGRK